MTRISARSVACVLAALASLGTPVHAGAQPAAPATVQSYDKLVSAYTNNRKSADATYTQKRLVFSGQVTRMGTDPHGTLFGTMSEDGSRFDTHFSVAEQNALKAKFKDGKIEPFSTSENFVFECLNEGILPNSPIAWPQLKQCRVLK